MERNIDKIRRLEKELAAERERRRNADKEIVRMHKVVERSRIEATEQANELSIANIGFSVAMAIYHGTPVGDGVWEVVVPVYSPTAICKEYTMGMRRDGEMYVVRAEKR